MEEKNDKKKEEYPPIKQFDHFKQQEGVKPGKGGIRPPDNTGKKKKRRIPKELDKRQHNQQPEKWVDVDIEKVKDFCSIGCTKREVASYFNVDSLTVDKAIREYNGMSWKDFFNEHSNRFKISLRRMQYLSALGDFDEEGNKYRAYPSVQMQIWLGKNHLGQTDKTETEVTERTNIPLFQWGSETEEADAEDVTDQSKLEEAKRRLSEKKGKNEQD